jgi:hypothetical protein
MKGIEARAALFLSAAFFFRAASAQVVETPVRILPPASVAVQPAGLGLADTPAVRSILDGLAAKIGTSLQAGLGPYAESLIGEARRLRARREPGDLPRLRSLERELKDLREIVTSLPEGVRESLLDECVEVHEEAYSRGVEAVLSRVREAGELWGDAARLESETVALAAAPSLKDALDIKLADHSRALKAAGRSRAFGFVEGPLSRRLLRRRVERIERLRLGLASAENPLDFARENLGSGPRTSEDRRLVDGLKPYSRGLDPSLIWLRQKDVELYSSQGFSASGWVQHARLGESPGSPEVAFLAVAHQTSTIESRIRVLVHESFHQGDSGYPKAIARCMLLFGRGRGEALWSALTEAYTEWRAREAMLRLLEDGLEGRSPLGKELERWLLEQGLGIDRKMAGKQLESLWNGDAYTPNVKMIAPWIRTPGGREALDRFVSEGDLAPLAALVGRERLEGLADLARLQADVLSGPPGQRVVYPGSRRDRIVLGSGLDRWFDAPMAKALSDGALSRGEIRRIRTRMEEFLRLAEAAKRLEPVSFDRMLDASVSDEEAAGLMRSAAEAEASRWPLFRVWDSHPFAVVGAMIAGTLTLTSSSSALWLALAWCAGLLGMYVWKQAEKFLRLLIWPQRRMPDLLR